MSKRLSIDRTPNGTTCSQEDPMKIKLRKIAESRVQVPSHDLIIKKIKDQLDSRLIMTQTNKPQKSVLIKYDSEQTQLNSPQSNPLPNLRSYKKKQKRSPQNQHNVNDASNYNGVWKQTLNIPYYRKIMKVPLAQLKNDLEHLMSPTAADGSGVMRLSMSVGQNLKASVNGGERRILPPILTPTHGYLGSVIGTASTNNINSDLHQNLKLSLLPQFKEDQYNSTKSRQLTQTSKMNSTQKSDKPQQGVFYSQEMLISGSQVLNRNNQGLFLGTTIETPAEQELDNSASIKRSFSQQKLQLKVFNKKGKKNMSQDNSLTNIGFSEQGNLPLLNSLQINNVKGGDQPTAAPSQYDRQYLTLINNKKLKISKSKINQALMRWNEQRMKDRYNGQSQSLLTQEDKADLISSCLMINQPVEKEDHQLDKSYVNKTSQQQQLKVIPSVENLMKQLNL